MPSKNVIVSMWYPNMQEKLNVIELANRLDRAVSTAYENFLKHTQEKVGDNIFIFVAPDMYFSNRSGERRSLTAADGNYLIDRFSKFSKNHPNMLLVAGTLEWRKEINSPGLGEDDLNASIRRGLAITESMHGNKNRVVSESDVTTHRDAIFRSGFAYRNTALIFCNGKFNLYDKKICSSFLLKNKSDPHFIDREGGFFCGERSNIFSALGTIFCIEICLDHQMQRGCDDAIKTKKTPQIQILISNSEATVPKSVVCTQAFIHHDLPDDVPAHKDRSCVQLYADRNVKKTLSVPRDREFFYCDFIIKVPHPMYTLDAGLTLWDDRESEAILHQIDLSANIRDDYFTPEYQRQLLTDTLTETGFFKDKEQRPSAPSARAVSATALHQGKEEQDEIENIITEYLHGPKL